MSKSTSAIKPSTPKKKKATTVSKDVSIFAQVVAEHPDGFGEFTWEKLSKTSRMFDHSSRFVPGVGDSQADLFFIGQAPGREEDVNGVPFCGPAGQTFHRKLGEVGIVAEKSWITNLFKEYTPGDREPSMKEVKEHMPYLIHEIEAVKPKVIVLLGNSPLQAFFNIRGITKVHGKIYTIKMSYGEVKVVPMFHPSYVMRRSDDRVTGLKFTKDLTQIKRLADGSASSSVTTTKGKLIETIEDFDKLMEALSKEKIVDFDLETTTKKPDTGKIICISFSVRPYKAAVLPLHLNWKDGKEVKQYKYWGAKHGYVMGKLKEFFESEVSKCAQAGHLIDIPFLRAERIKIKHYDYDAIVMHHLLDENAELQERGLKEFAWEYTDMGGYEADLEAWVTKLEDREIERLKAKNLPVPKRSELNISFASIPFDVLWPYSAADADVLGRVRRILYEKLEKQDLVKLFRRISMRVQMVLCELEYNGIKINRKKLKEIQDEYRQLEDDITQQLNEHTITKKTLEILNKQLKEKTPKTKKVITEVNYGSPTQLRIVLFDLLGLTPLNYSKKTKEPSTDEETLKSLEDAHEVPRMILQKRQYGYFQKFYSEKFEESIDANDRIHTTYYLYGTGTGRLSSQRPNLQNIPSADSQKPIAAKIRDIFIAEPGHVLIDADYSQIEFRLLANYTKDQAMLSDIENDVDIHVENAMLIYGCAREDVTKEKRQSAKALTYALIYGASAYRLAQVYGFEVERGQEIIDHLLTKKYPGASRYHEAMKFSARSKGYVKNLFGRRRRLPEILSDNQKLRGHAERQAINAPIQGLAGDLLYAAMIRLQLQWEADPFTKMVLTTHDSLTHEVKVEDQNRAVAIIHNEMTRPFPGLVVPLPVEIKVGTSLGKMKGLSREEVLEIVKQYA